MKKIFGSRIFVILSTVITAVIGGLGGYFGSFKAVGGGASSVVSGIVISRPSQQVFDWKEAIGYWAFGLILTGIVFLLCSILRALYTQKEEG